MDLGFVINYSLGGALVLPFVYYSVWLPAAVIGRESPRCWRFWIEIPFAMTAAFLIVWSDDNFSSMAGMDETVKVIQFVRPALAELFCSLIASWLWMLGRELAAPFEARKDVDAQH